MIFSSLTGMHTYIGASIYIGGILKLLLVTLVQVHAALGGLGYSITCPNPIAIALVQKSSAAFRFAIYLLTRKAAKHLLISSFCSSSLHLVT